MNTENPMQASVREWHEKFGVVVGDSVAIRRPSLRAELIREEAAETVDAIERGDLVEAIDGMCDLLYVVFGTAVEFGVNLAPFFDEVHRTNMLKVGGATRADGKILKPEGWERPHIAQLLAEQQR
jgi:predicted HAD superfamily Cof-like phosphohydrolase